MYKRERDISLAIRSANGDPVALNLLLTQTRSRLRAYLSVQVPPDLARVVDTEDIVQEAHVEVFRRIARFEPRGEDSFFRFTAKIAVNLLLSAIKRHRAVKRGGGKTPITHHSNYPHSSADLFNTLTGQSPTPIHVVARDEAALAVQDAIGNLPEHYGQAIHLAYIEGKPVKDVALVLGRSERAIRGQCRVSLKMLHAKLGACSELLTSPG